MGRTKKDKPSTFGATLTALMAEKGMSVADAARIAKVSTSVLVGWRAGKAPQDFEAVQRLADHLSVSLTWLLLGRNDKRSKAPTIAEVLTPNGDIFEGIVRVRLERLVPRTDLDGKKTDGGDND